MFKGKRRTWLFPQPVLVATTAMTGLEETSQVCCGARIVKPEPEDRIREASLEIFLR